MNDLFKEFVKIKAPQSEVSSFALMGVVETRSRGGVGMETRPRWRLPSCRSVSDSDDFETFARRWGIVEIREKFAPGHRGRRTALRPTASGEARIPGRTPASRRIPVGRAGSKARDFFAAVSAVVAGS